MRGAHAAIAIAFVLGASANAHAQWSPGITLADGVATGIVRASGDVLHVAYSAGLEVHYRQSADQGGTWGIDSVIATNGHVHYTDPIAVSGSDVYVLYLSDLRSTPTFYGSDEVGNLSLLHSGDGGSTWDPPCPLTTTDDVFRASMDVAGSRVDIAWSNYATSMGGTIHYVASASAGACGSFGPIVNLGGTNASRPQVASSGSYVHIVWEAEDNPARSPCFTIPGPCPDNYYVRSVDGGSTFEPVQHITDYTVPMDRAVIGRPEITVVPGSGNVVFVFQDNPTNVPTGQDLFARVSTQNGASGSWSNPIRVTNAPGTGNHPAAAGVGATAFLAWTDNPGDPTGGDTAMHPWFSMSSDGGNTWLAPEQVSNQGGLFANAVAATSGFAHVVFNPFSGGTLSYSRRALSAPPGDGGAAGSMAASDAGGASGSATSGAGAGSTTIGAGGASTASGAAGAAAANGETDTASGCSCKTTPKREEGAPYLLATMIGLVAVAFRRTRGDRARSGRDTLRRCRNNTDARALFSSVLWGSGCSCSRAAAPHRSRSQRR